MAEHQFRVMASAARVICVDADHAAATWAEARLRQLEERWSRFLPGSDISRINTSGGGWLDVSSDTVVLIETMQLASTATAGAYDPTMLCEIVEAGYRHSHEDPGRIGVTVDLPSIGASVHDIEIDRGGCRVYVPPGLGLDPGGIGKGLAADLVVSELVEYGVAGALASVGGDLAFAGRPAVGDHWEISVGDPFDDAGEVYRFGVDAGGVATSSTRSRRWITAGRSRHHILDPRSRSSSTTDLAAVSVVANAGWMAEALATAAILEGSDRVVDFFERNAMSGVIVGSDRSVMVMIEGRRDLEADRQLEGARP